MRSASGWTILAAVLVTSGNAMPIDRSDDSPNDLTPDSSGSEFNEGPEYYQGDIMGMDEITARNGVLDRNWLWRYRTVYYIIEPIFSPEDRVAIQEGMQEYHRKTCIRFVPLPPMADRPPWMDDYVYITSNRTGCHSYIGRRGKGQQVNLQSPGCMSRGTIVHELMHALGFGHEQSRPDRDKHVKIEWDYIPQDKRNNFVIDTWPTTTVLDVQYDFESVMHYPANGFSNTTGQNTITPLTGNQYMMGQREGFSFHDLQKINRLYSCT